jgi:hypothetical protein
VADFSTDYVTLNSMPTATAASNAKVTPNLDPVPDPAGFENSNPVHPYLNLTQHICQKILDYNYPQQFYGPF